MIKIKNKGFLSNISLTKKIIYFITKPITQKTLQFKNLHQGESCYIFGDGASIKWFNLNMFPKKPTFTLKSMLFHKESESLDIKYSLVIEPWFFYPYFRDSFYQKEFKINKIQRKYHKYIKGKKNINFFVNLSCYPLLSGKNIYYLFKAINDKDFEFLNECTVNEEDIFKGSFHCAIALAIYMGFKNILLVGCDYTHKSYRPLHWYEKGKSLLSHVEPNYCKKYLSIAQKYANITTITNDTGGTFIPSITYENYTKKTPVYRENNELLDYEILKSFATWPGYKIF